MKIYLAGKFGDKPKLAKYRDQLIELGHDITFDWISFEQNKHRPLVQLCINSTMDIGGVVKADVVIAIMDDPSYAYRGTFTELGAAFAMGKRVIIVTPGITQLLENAPKKIDLDLYQEIRKFKFTCQTNVFYFYGVNKKNIAYVDTWEDVLDIVG